MLEYLSSMLKGLGSISNTSQSNNRNNNDNFILLTYNHMLYLLNLHIVNLVYYKLFCK
jgi:hypothetical protein